MNKNLGNKDSYSKTNFKAYCDLVAKKDKRVQKIIDEFGYPPFWHRNPDFENLVWIILEQQVSLASAYAVLQKLKNGIGTVTPKKILKLSDEEFKVFGFSRQKRTYVKGLAEEILSGNIILNVLINDEIPSIRKELTAIKGIGDWTADVFLLSCLHKLDVFPIGDLALIKSMVQAGFIKEKEDRESILRKTKKFQPYRSIFSILMWHRYIQVNNIKVQFDL